MPTSFNFADRVRREATPGVPVQGRPRPGWDVAAAEVQRLKADPPIIPPAAFAQLTLDPGPARAGDKLDLAALAPAVGNGFEGITQGPYLPADPTVGAGPLDIFSAGNVSVTVTNKDGTSRVETDGQAFFGVPAAEGAISNAQSYYDAVQGRFVAVCFTQGTLPSNFSNFYLAISKTNDARGAWWLYKLDMTKDGATPTANWSDYEGLGISGDKLVLSSEQYSFAADAYQYQKFRIIDRAQAYAGAPLAPVDIVNFAPPAGGDAADNFVTKPARNLTPGDNTIHCLCVRTGSGTRVTYRTITGPPSAPVLSTGSLIPVSAYSAPPDAAQGGSLQLVVTGDCRPTDFYVRNGVLVCSWPTDATIGGGSVSAIRLLRLRTGDGAVLTDETFGQANTFDYYPAVTVDSVGTVFLGFGRSSPTEFPSAYASGRRRSDTAIEPSALLKAGVSNTIQTRWGDYTGIDQDASLSTPAGTAAWYAGEWVKGINTFGTWIGRLSFTYAQVFGTVADDCDGSAATTADRTPIAGVTVNLVQGAITVATTTTNGLGQFSFGYLDSGTYDVQVVPPAGGTNVDAVAGGGGISQSRISASDVRVVLTSVQSSAGDNFTVASAKPTAAIVSISPATRSSGASAFTLAVNGSGFTACSAIRLDGSNRPTTFVSASQLTAQIPAADQAAPGTRAITVFTPAPGGGTSNAQTLTIPDTTPPAAAVTSPVGGESWVAGTTHPITWTATDDAGVTAVDLWLSTDGGATFPTVIASALPNTGTFSWLVPATPAGAARVRLRAADGAGNSGWGTSPAAFAIIGSPRSLTIHVIGAGTVAKSPDQSAYPEGSWVQLTGNPGAGWAFAAWSGDLVSTTDPAGLQMSADRSVTATFVDVAAPAVSVTAPNGGEVLSGGTGTNLTWNAWDNAGVTAVDLELSRSGPAGPWEPIAMGIPNSGSYTWIATFPPTTHAVLRATAHDGAGHASQDVSDGEFVVANTAGVDGTVADFALAAVWPNPARRSVRVQFALPREATVHLGLHDVQGREVAALADGTYPAGRHTVDWSAAVSPPDPGLYFLRLTLPGLTLVRRFVLVK